MPNKSAYHSKITTLLSDDNTYKTLKPHPTQWIQGKGHQLPKTTHQRKYPGDCIDSDIKSVTYDIANHLTTILAHLVINTPCHPRILMSSTVQDLRHSPEEIMVSCNVTSFFTCIPTSEGVETVQKKENGTLDQRTNFTPEQISYLL